MHWNGRQTQETNGENTGTAKNSTATPALKFSRENGTGSPNKSKLLKIAKALRGKYPNMALSSKVYIPPGVSLLAWYLSITRNNHRKSAGVSLCFVASMHIQQQALHSQSHSLLPHSSIDVGYMLLKVYSTFCGCVAKLSGKLQKLKPE